MAYELELDGILSELVLIVQHKEDDKYKHPGYRQACNHADEMAVHLYGVKPEKLLNRVRPREDQAIKDYRLESYEPTTKSTAEKGVSLVNKIFNPKLYAIHPAAGDKGELLFTYATQEYPVFNSVVNFLSAYGLKKTLADPNGIFLVEPSKNPESVTERISPVVNCYSSCDVWLVKDGLIVIYLYEEKDSQGVPIYYFKLVDRQVITVISLTSKNKKDWTYTEESTYQHAFGDIPAWPLGGTFNEKSSLTYGAVFESFFYPAVPFWNKAICAESDLDGAFIAHLHPQKWEVADECEFVEMTDGGNYACTGGYIFDQIKGKKYQCPSCGGSGRKSVKGPYQTYQVSRDKLNDASGNSLNQPPAGYLDVPTAATEMLVERVDKLLERGLSALSMDIVNKIGNNQSGEAKAYDRTELFDFLGKIRDLFYDKHLVNIFHYFAQYMFINEDTTKIEPEITKPNDFDIFTTQELIDQLKTAKDSSINPSYMRAKQMDVQNKEFQTRPQELQFLNLVVALDPYAEIPRADVDLMIFGGTVSKINAVIHDNIHDFVRRAMEEDSNFGGKSYIDQMEILKGFAEEMLEQIEEDNKVEIDQSAIAPDGLPPVDKLTDEPE